MSLSDRLRGFFATHPAPREAPTFDSASPTWTGPFGGPSQPVPAIFPTAELRYFDYVFSINANVVPRTEYPQLANFNQLWSAYLTSTLIQVAVTFRTQQILSLSWRLTPREGSGSIVNDEGINEARRLLDLPDPQMDRNFEGWLRAIMEEIYVTDALSIAPVKNRLGRTIAFRQIDGQTIKPLIDYDRGGFPTHPDPAFIQYVKGTPYTWATKEQLLYKIFRPRSWCIYGQSRVETVLLALALYQLHEQWTADYFTQGNIPEAALITDPTATDLTNEDKFVKWQATLDATAGVNVGRRRLHLMPSFVKDIKPMKAFSFDVALPEWIVRLLCIEFGMPTHLFASQTNRATAKEMNEALYDAPLRMDLMSIKRLLDRLLTIAGYGDLEFEWSKDLDYSKEAVEGISMLVANGVMSPSEARGYLGLLEDTESGANTGGEEEQPPAATPPGEQEPEQPREEPPPAAPAPEAKPSVSEGGGQVANLETRSPVLRFKRNPLVPRAAKPRVGRGKFSGPKAADRARLATSLAPIIAKRLRQNQSKVMRAALEQARARGKRVEGV